MLLQLCCSVDVDLSGDAGRLGNRFTKLEQSADMAGNRFAYIPFRFFQGLSRSDTARQVGNPSRPV
ncbi:MAG: hypothetical protein QOJ99_4520 [Bryobacterales bacterium]|jgi:hypothetical protein|nr:hypothetical protein [Bryobacterales bacterium]